MINNTLRTRKNNTYKDSNNNKKAFQLQASRPLANSLGFIVNKVEHVRDTV